MIELVKSNETEKSEQNYIYSAKDIWELSNSSSRSWDRFVADFLIAIDGDQKRDYLEEHASRNGGNKYTEKTLKTFQSWLLRNQANQGRASATIKEATTQAVEKDWYSKQELAIEFGVDPKTIQRIVNEQITLDRPVQTKKGGYNNSEIFYNKDVYNMITAKLSTNEELPK